MNSKIVYAYASLESSKMTYNEVLTELSRITGLSEDQIDREVSSFISNELKHLL